MHESMMACAETPDGGGLDSIVDLRGHFRPMAEHLTKARRQFGRERVMVAEVIVAHRHFTNEVREQAIRFTKVQGFSKSPIAARLSGSLRRPERA